MAEMAAVKDVAALEVYNGSADPCGRADSSNEWAMCFEKNYYFGGLAVDDVHTDDMFFMGWTWLKMESASPENVVKALKTGAYYASCGPTISAFSIQDDAVVVECSPAWKIIVTSLAHGLGRRAWAREDPLLTHARFPLTEPMKSWPFLRAIVIYEAGNKAWTHPIPLPSP